MCKFASVFLVAFMATSSLATFLGKYSYGYGGCPGYNGLTGYNGFPGYGSFPAVAAPSCGIPQCGCQPLQCGVPPCLPSYPFAFPAPGCDIFKACLCKKLKPCLMKKALLAKCMYKKNLLANKLLCGCDCGCGCGCGL